MADASGMTTMDMDDLDNLIADSLGGVSAALESERKPVAPAPPAAGAGEVIKELQQGAAKSEEPAGDDVFSNLMKNFQDENFQKVMSDILSASDAQAAPLEDASQSTPASGSAVPFGPKADTTDPSMKDFLQNTLQSFEAAVGNDQNFEKSLTSLMTSMLSNELMCEPLQQIATALEPWLQSQTSLSASERARYESQLRLYHQIIGIYKCAKDPLPEDARDQVQRLLGELQALGQPPDEVMKQLAPKEDGEDFEDFMKSSGICEGLGPHEQDLLKKLAEDPQELTKVMQDMAGQLGAGSDEDCKQQ